MKLKIKNLIIAQIYIILFVEFFVSVLKFPSILRYVVDVNLLLIMLFYMTKEHREFISKEYRVIKNLFILYMIFMVLHGVFAFVPVGQIAWAVRNNFFYIFFLFFATYYLEVEDFEKIFDNLCKIQIINVLLGSFEYFVLHVNNDYLGGIFGIDQGCNAYLNIYTVIICAYTFTRYMSKKTSIINVGLIFCSSLYMAALSELKVLYVEIILIVLLAALLSGNISRTIGIVLVSGIGMYFGILVMSMVNPESVEFVTNIDNMISYGSRADYGYGDIRIARMTAIAQINDYFFKGNISNVLFGYGFGSCEESITFSVCNSDFADKYSYLGYRNLTTSMNYLETGAIGLIAFVCIFVLIFLLAQRTKHYLGNQNNVAVLSQIMVVMSILNFIYNSSIRRMISYLIFFVFAYMFAVLRDNMVNSEEQYVDNK